MKPMEGLDHVSIGSRPPAGARGLKQTVKVERAPLPSVAPPRGGARIETSRLASVRKRRGSRPPAGARGLKLMRQANAQSPGGRAPPRGRAD